MSFVPDLFKEKTVVVIGGTSGIGAAAAAAFAELGAEVHVAGLNAGSPEAPAGPHVSVTELDVRNGAVLAALLDPLPRIDVLINCAGVSRDRNEWNPETFADVMSINFFPVMEASRLARPKMGSGSAIVNIASMYATFGAADRPAYASSKGAIVQLTKSLAQEFAPEVRVNAVAPGWIVTPLSKGLFANEAASGPIMARIPFARWGEAREIADAIVYLASPAASYVTGIVLPIDGGYLTV
ncbi:NAD(P)-dependent dehydrogenase (short-subunit alcohol dehydrogenase family) [Rhizobium sp. PP-F2F-G38]|uniref:SDR family oxidoreductase n=1 Tax=Ferranicluibacter rubi TaxID=2715133 RepID=A0AA43ZDR3_9HYPH|nr:SDR family oxidoreductase [Ferranicluibacter rubi]PYE32617.1 NAD(P)-dependent dehydrogenase (short-subunit alcohol dehydrogenase family) [Rhizobium sp. PP-WC-1G-195]PYE96046.1 NAD(P)-dependent dehydrogenase (short-subunit alcohol dehydrogenase family) [Rhizobium sp. PP-F2F-G38]TCP88349.1 NAD(P)-dependent dehydrogenase (short-subunit alcohol dehydrogenase family) [Rhizobium sp. PP-CC-2G-626]TCQ22986.1 NAD(P)-dependent dehydrogenase (short-subunit alcohol dehydrogenase family) [Rhizobium sp. P